MPPSHHSPLKTLRARLDAAQPLWNPKPIVRQPLNLVSRAWLPNPLARPLSQDVSFRRTSDKLPIREGRTRAWKVWRRRRWKLVAVGGKPLGAWLGTEGAGVRGVVGRDGVG